MENFELGMPFFYRSKKILFSLWKIIQDTTDEILAGLITSISIICSNKEKIRPNHICKYLGINLSTLEYQVKEKIIKKYKISGFTSLIASSEIIKRLIFRTILTDDSPKIVEIHLGTAQKIFNKNDNIKYYLFALKTKVKYPIYISTRIFVTHNSKKPQISKIIILELELIRINSSKGPPSLFTVS